LERFNLRINYLACTNRRILTPDQSLEARARMYATMRCDVSKTPLQNTTDTPRRRFLRLWTAAW
jgi:hypothetical protein